MNPVEAHQEILADTIIKQFRKRQMDGYYCPAKEDAVALANSWLTKNSTVAYGGSATLAETGMLASLQNNPDITLLDRNIAVDAAETTRIFHQSFDADYYFMSSNAVTADGMLVNIDGNGNRVAALIYGPKEVIVLAGMNKVTNSLEEAVSRIHNHAAPPNNLRLNKNTPCAATGQCADCLSPDCICNQLVITRRSGIAGRIKIILIGENCGF